MTLDTTKLAKKRKKLELSLTEMGSRVGLSASMVSMVERGHRTSEKSVRRMAKELKIPFSHLVVKEDVSARPQSE